MMTTVALTHEDVLVIRYALDRLRAGMDGDVEAEIRAEALDFPDDGEEPRDVDAAIVAALAKLRD